MRWLLRLNLLAILLALCVIPLGAYTRLTDAGLGCPDWPGCYGQMFLPQTEQHIQHAQLQFPEREFVAHKARNEMVHRYIAGLLGLSVLTIFALSWILKRERILTAGIWGLVIFQAALGMWTVTLNLMPLVVMGHLLGGFFLLSLLVVLRVQLAKSHYHSDLALPRGLLILGTIALALLVGQIALGGWTSANYAATICHQLPLCEAGWSNHFSLRAALSLPLGKDTYEYGVLAYDGRMSIHVLHRLGALCAALALWAFAFALWRHAPDPGFKLGAGILAGLVLLQVLLGLINVIAYVPLFNALAHNFVAATLLAFSCRLLWLLRLRGANKVRAGLLSLGGSYGLE